MTYDSRVLHYETQAKELSASLTLGWVTEDTCGDTCLLDWY